jgi:Transglycosylase SLT domain
MVIDSPVTQGAGSLVVGAIRTAARATGTNFQYLLATAQVESGLDPNAAVSSSSAKGLFQFIDQTWLTTLKEAGPALGYGRYADAIVKSPSGRYEVPDPEMRRKIFSLRDDPTANAAMAGAFTQQNAALLTDRIGRPPTEGELYVAHFLGASGAARLINRAASSPNETAAAVFPSAARANKSIFYDHQGQPRSVAGVYRLLVGRYDVARAMPSGPASPAVAANATVGPPLVLAAAASMSAATSMPARAAAPSAPAPQGDGRPLFTSLYSGEGQSGPVSQFVKDLWTTRPVVAAALTGQVGNQVGNPVGNQAGNQISPQMNTGRVSPAPQSQHPPGAPLDLFSDRPTDAKGLFGVSS